MREHQLMPLFLDGEKLLDKIQVNGEASDEREAEQQEYRPYFVLDTELLPPLCGPSVHRTASSRAGHWV
jgi:hypothetical protein